MTRTATTAMPLGLLVLLGIALALQALVPATPLADINPGVFGFPRGEPAPQIMTTVEVTLADAELKAFLATHPDAEVLWRDDESEVALKATIIVIPGKLGSIDRQALELKYNATVIEVDVSEAAPMPPDWDDWPQRPTQCITTKMGVIQFVDLMGRALHTNGHFAAQVVVDGNLQLAVGAQQAGNADHIVRVAYRIGNRWQFVEFSSELEFNQAWHALKTTKAWSSLGRLTVGPGTWVDPDATAVTAQRFTGTKTPEDGCP